MDVHVFILELVFVLLSSECTVLKYLYSRPNPSYQNPFSHIPGHIRNDCIQMSSCHTDPNYPLIKEGKYVN